MASRQIDLHEKSHPRCMKCKPAARKEHAPGGICGKVGSVDDELSVRCVGDWAYDKIFHLYQYFGIFTHGMKNRWGGLNYVEICSGPGRCIFKETGAEVDGTALAVLKHSGFGYVSKALFIDNDSKAVDVLNARIQRLDMADKAVATVGDYTNSPRIVEFMKGLPQGHLNLVFIDPTDCSVPFETIVAIVNGLKSVDLIINLPTYMDAGRNLAMAVNDPSYGKARQKYAEFLGVPAFFDDEGVRAMARAGDDRGLRMAFRDCYREQLAGLGHTYWGTRDIHGLYDLVFASGSPKGLEFWNKACAIEPDGQRDFNFGS